MEAQPKCYPTMPITSPGFWLQGSPFAATLPLLLTQMVTIIGMSKAMHYFLRRLGQPLIVSQMLTGIVLGPSCLGRLAFVKGVLFSERSWIELNIVGFLGLVFFRFIIGIKTDLSLLLQTRAKVALIALSCRFTPVLMIILGRVLLLSQLPEEVSESGILSGLATVWSLSSFIVISALLDELRLLNSKVGRLAIAAALVDNLLDTGFRVICATVRDVYDGINGPQVFGVISSFICLIVFILIVARPVSLWIIRRTPEGEQLDEVYFVAILMLSLACGLFSEAIGYHLGLGMLLMGLSLPSGPPLGYTLVERLEGLILALSMPVFMSRAGFITDIPSLVIDWKTWVYVELFIFLTVIGKIASVVVVCACFKMPLLEGLTLGLIMSTKGYQELETLISWVDQQILTKELASIMALSVPLVTMITTPLIVLLYRPSAQYVDYNWRTIEHSKIDAELRVLACVHNQDDVGPIVSLLECVHPSADCLMSVYVLHLVQLVGRATSVLLPYCKHKNSATVSDSDRIVNAFRQFAQQHQEKKKQREGSISVQPFVSISPHATMHDDVCTLAVDKKATLVVLPFHKESSTINGRQAMSHAALKTVNNNVVGYAPCSVAILAIPDAAENTTTTNVNVNAVKSTVSPLCSNAAVFFLGGPDDREALALSMRMVVNSGIKVTVLRFLPPEELRTNSGEEKLDDEMVDSNAKKPAQLAGGSVAYMEEVVHDGEHLIAVIQEVSGGYDLLIVGRREGVESPLTSGLSMWSDNAELGVVGDMLVSSDFGSRVPILVVQQQAMLR